MSEAIPLEDNFDWWWYKSKRNYLKFIINQHNFSIPIKILEIGPGKGNNIELLNSYGEVSVLEIEEEFILHLGNKKFIDKEKIFSSFEQLIDKYKFDLIVLLDVLEHIEDTSRFSKTMVVSYLLYLLIRHCGVSTMKILSISKDIIGN